MKQQREDYERSIETIALQTQQLDKAVVVCITAIVLIKHLSRTILNTYCLHFLSDYGLQIFVTAVKIF